MSTAYKHLYSCATFLIFIFVFNFYKNRITVSRDREVSFRAASKLKRAGALNRPLPLDESGEDFLFGFSFLDEEESVVDRRYDGWHWDRLKQYPGRCLDVEVFFLPSTTSTGRKNADVYSVRRSRTGSPLEQEGLHYKNTVQAARRRDQLEAPDETNSSVYVFLSVLVILLLAAGVDIAKHLTATRSPQEHTQRRLSLQNYQALIREKQKQFRMMKQHYSQPSMSIQRSMDEPGHSPAVSFAYVGPGRSGEDKSSAMMTPSSQGPPVAPLLRRQSVPTLMRGQLSASNARNVAPSGPSPFGRRTSMDSFWDTADLHLTKPGCSASPSGGLGNGSSPEVRRRVRMLHRH